MDDPPKSAAAHLWGAPAERVDPAELLLGRLVAGAGSPARFHVTANGGWVGAPAEEVDETKPRPLSLSRSSQTPRRSLGCLVRRLSDSHSALWSIRGMNELTKAADVTSEAKSLVRGRLSPRSNHFRCSRQLRRFRCRACPGHFRLNIP